MSKSSDYEEIRQELLHKAAESLDQILENSKTFTQSEPIKKIDSICKKYKIPMPSFKVSDAIDLIDAARHDKDNLYSTIANKVVSNLMSYVKVPFLDLSIDEIEIKTQGAKRGVKFNVNLGTVPIKRAVKFVVVLDGQQNSIAEIKLKIDISAGLNDCQILANKNGKKISATLHIELQISTEEITTPIASSTHEIILGKREFDVELFDFQLSGRKSGSKPSN